MYHIDPIRMMPFEGNYRPHTLIRRSHLDMLKIFVPFLSFSLMCLFLETHFNCYCFLLSHVDEKISTMT